MLLLLFSVLLIFETGAAAQLCSVRKSENSCVCKRVTSDDQTTTITEADCARIGLRTFPNDDQLVSDLNLLDLRHNAIADLDVQFSSATLETLILSYNQITSISAQVFRSVPNLETLNLSHNNITTISGQAFQNLPKLAVLDLSYNSIKTLPVNVLQPLKLRELDLSYNSGLGEWLTQTADSLTIDLGLSPDVVSLKLDNIGLDDLHNLYFANFTKLEHLSLADNRFQEVPRVPYSVQYLDLSGSEIQILQVKHLSYHSLKVLKLERMKKLESIHPYAFYNLEKLQELSIKYCPNLKEFNEAVFGLLSKTISLDLKRLALSGNALQSLNSTYKYLFRQLEFVDLTDNPWKCDCDLLWLQEFENLYRSDNVKCSAPYRVSSKSVFDITDQNLPGCYPQKYGKKSHRILIAMLTLMIIVLAALVAYLIYYSPNWYNNRAGLGPQSPYNMARTEGE